MGNSEADVVKKKDRNYTCPMQFETFQCIHYCYYVISGYGIPEQF